MNAVEKVDGPRSGGSTTIKPSETGRTPKAGAGSPHVEYVEEASAKKEGAGSPRLVLSVGGVLGMAIFAITAVML